MCNRKTERLFCAPQTQTQKIVASAFLSLGSNQGDREEHLRAAVEGLHAATDIRVEAASPVYETEAHTARPDEEQPGFLNAVLQASVTCPPEALLRTAQAVERSEGRDRTDPRKWPPRPLDIDLLVVGDVTRQTDVLKLPHPRLAERRFVLRPWADVAPNLHVPPPFDAPVCTLHRACSDPAAVVPTSVSLSVPNSGKRDSSSAAD